MAAVSWMKKDSLLNSVSVTVLLLKSTYLNTFLSNPEE